ncbi:hypothetical protein [Constantimarinum furrinae]|uniref:Uncharacterized protein n=1 Tax=Constantimarinum furrinae TaxID=2562285 RepID=A0A7G8PRC3_9FLAO|nr:hypothetical protein [Constantimarinum furrinae]QNJ96889.1 hypothetical protein ALE3EI_0302 [Constantimarinum furrinae]
MRNTNSIQSGLAELLNSVLFITLFISLAYYGYEAMQEIWNGIAANATSEMNRWTL